MNPSFISSHLQLDALESELLHSEQQGRGGGGEGALTLSGFSVFDALRDTIYSEVATLIANNEARPHFLVELFRELQMLTTDYLRQRALYNLQELVTRFLTEEGVAQEAKAATTAAHMVHCGCACVCVHVCMCGCVHACVHVRVRARERERIAQ